MQLKCYEVTFGNPRKELTTTITVSAPDEQSAIIEARLDATKFGTRGNVTRVPELPPVKT